MILGFLLAVSLTCDPALTARFTPARSPLGDYRVCTTEDGLERVRQEPPPDLSGAHFGRPEEMAPLDAFGLAGPLDRAALARLYSGRSVRIVRGWAVRQGQFTSITLLSPYPDASLSSLHPGTMVIAWTAPR